MPGSCGLLLPVPEVGCHGGAADLHFLQHAEVFEHVGVGEVAPAVALGALVPILAEGEPASVAVAGWAVSHISDGVNSLEIYPSRVTGLGIEALTERVIVLLKMDRQGLSIKESCSWGDEPGEYRWVLENDAGKLRIDILWFDEPYSHLSDEYGRVLFSTECSLLKFAIQVKTELRDLDALGKVGQKPPFS